MKDLVAPIRKSLIYPRLILGLPSIVFWEVLLFAFYATFVLRQIIIGPIIAVILLMLGRYAASKDPFFFEIIVNRFKFGAVLK
jgi:type IV secretory pathway VirB3-like protein